MRSLPISRRRILVLACVVLASVLNLTLTRFGHQIAVTYCDYRVELRKGPPGEAIIPFGGSIADTLCMGQMSPAEKPRRIAAFSEAYGVFPAQNIQPRIALWGGVALPTLLFALSIFLAFGIRRMIAVTIFLPGLLLTTEACFQISDEYHFWTNLFERYGSWQILPVLLLGLALVCSGIWLWRTRSPKQPA